MTYTLIQQFNDQHAHIRFSGIFNGEVVTWDTSFFTLNGFMMDKNHQNTSLKQFINIEVIQSGLMRLTVVLKIDKVSPPDIQKMMIMIKQYKQLSLGRHEYG